MGYDDSRHRRSRRSLERFFAQGLITEVLHVVKSGKEATVYCCEAGKATGTALIAAKVYKNPRWHRFRDPPDYEMDRTDPFHRRDHLALEKKSRHGRELQFGSWIDAEYQTLARLHEAGADVPRPIERSSTASIEDIGERDRAATPLSRLELEPAEAFELCRTLLRSIALWLRCDRVPISRRSVSCFGRGA